MVFPKVKYFRIILQSDLQVETTLKNNPTISLKALKQNVGGLPPTKTQENLVEELIDMIAIFVTIINNHHSNFSIQELNIYIYTVLLNM